MATTLEDRAAIRTAWYSLMNSSPEDDALAEGFASADEHANEYIQEGLESAQVHVIEYAADGAMRWLKRLGPITWLDDPGVGKYVDLPDDFLRLSGDETHSCLLDRAGRPWGQLLDGRERNRHRFGHGFYLRNDRLYLIRNAPAPKDAVLEYHFRHPELTSDSGGGSGSGLWADGLWADGLWADGLWATGASPVAGDIDFPVADRWLIVAFAGYHAVMDAWVPGGNAMTTKVEANLKYWKAELARRQRRSRQPRRIRSRKPIGPNLLLGRRIS